MKKMNRKGFTLVELVVVILIIAILATATFLGGATVIKQARFAKVQTNLSNFATYAQDMMYSNPGITDSAKYANADAVKAKMNSDYLTQDFQLGTMNDSWGTEYELDFVNATVGSNALTYVLISSNGANAVDESIGETSIALNAIKSADHLSAQAAVDALGENAVGDDLGVIVLLRNGAVSTAYYGF